MSLRHVSLVVIINNLFFDRVACSLHLYLYRTCSLAVDDGMLPVQYDLARGGHRHGPEGGRGHPGRQLAQLSQLSRELSLSPSLGQLSRPGEAIIPF